MSVQKMRLGKFTQDQDGIFQGTISGLGLGSIDIISEEAMSLEGKPYLKLIADHLGAAYEVGAAFSKQKGDMDYYSVNLDSPIFPAPVSAALFHDRKASGEFNLVWERPEAFKPSVNATATATSQAPTNTQQQKRGSYNRTQGTTP